MRGLSRTHKIGDEEVTVHELRVDEIDAFLKEVDLEDDKSVYDVVLVKSVHLSAVARCLGITKQQLYERFPYPSELQFLASKCEEVNGGFFDVIRLAVRQLMSNLPGGG